MTTGLIGNPGSAHGKTLLDDTTTGGRTVWEYKTDGVVLEGDVLAWTTQTTDDVPTVHAADTDTDDPAVVCGVALEGAASGGIVRFVRNGPAKVNIGSGTVALGERAVATTTVGVADGVAADATTITGDSWGVFLGAEIGTTNQAVVDVRCG